MKLSKKQLILVGSFLFFYFVIKVALYFLNPTEVGDSYRFLKAGLSLSSFSYPLNEKRLPLFPWFLSLGVNKFVSNEIKFFDPIWWGRFVATVFCLGSLLLTFKISLRLFNNFRIAFFTLLLTALSPIFFYGTSRVLAEGQFAFFLLLFLYLYLLKKKYLVLGLVAGLCFLTRYEGALLIFAFGLDALIAKKFRNFGLLVLGFTLVASPVIVRNILIFANPIKSAYFLEPAGFSYNFKSVLIVVSAFLFCFGNLLISPLLLITSIKKLLVEHRPIFFYLIMSIALFFFWIAAMPRLFVYLIPVFAIFTVPPVLETLSKPWFKSKFYLITLFINTIVFILFRMEYRYHFLVLGKWFLLVFLVLSVATMLFFIADKAKLFLGFLALSILVSAVAYTIRFKDVYRTVYQAVLFSKDLDGKIAYSDETGITSWYLAGHDTLYFDDTDGEESVDFLRSQSVKYALVTNEFDEYRRLIFLEREDRENDVELVKKFTINDGGYIRYSKIFRLKY
ncbi:glycosyltransferase family 39 protein [Candidatus Parcubacteria bacterium]|nr:glycosyltransferase family 39 protein [Patescibacteria group bacterium]MBU4380825.1 glycosyltransferase family 39 protein [Patescibacteria group bacterium]MCG2689490.1 glycosyltransferase family 39 protein [Candidatus Parcubacteria bacterium]